MAATHCPGGLLSTRYQGAALLRPRWFAAPAQSNAEEVDRVSPQRGDTLSEARQRFVSSLVWCVLKFSVEPRQASLRVSPR